MQDVDMMPVPSEDTFSLSGVDDLFKPDLYDCLRGVRTIKHTIIGSKNRKSCFLQIPGVLPKLLEFLDESSAPDELLSETAIVLASLAKGSRKDIAHLIAESTVPKLLKGLHSPSVPYVEAYLRCLRTIFTTDLAPIDLIYQDESVVPQLIAAMGKSPVTQECVASILSGCCLNIGNQTILFRSNAVPALAPLLYSSAYAIQLCALKCYCALCYRNKQVSTSVVETEYCSTPILQQLVTLLSRSKPVDMQILAAKCITFVCRSGALPTSDYIITHTVMPALVRGCKSEPLLHSDDLCPDSASTLAYLIEEDPDLQLLTAWNNLILTTLQTMLNWPVPEAGGFSDISQYQKEAQLADEMHTGALKALAALASNNEDIRRKMTADVTGLLDKICAWLASGSTSPDRIAGEGGSGGVGNPIVQAAACRCLHSLSRSVQQLRTTFQEKGLWKSLLQLCRTGDDDLAAVASATLCNLTVEFSPCRQDLLDRESIDLFASFARRDDQVLRLNGIWALMNLAYKSDEKTKLAIVSSLGSDQFIRLLTDSVLPVATRLLGLIRNLLSNRLHVDHLMNGHGNQVMQVTTYILEGDYPPEVKEQTLCVLANIAHGDSSKTFVIDNDDILTKIANYLNHSNVRLQSAAAACIANLAWKEDPGSMDRQARLRDFNVLKVLQQLLSTEDPVLFDRVKIAVQQFQSS